ncbi:MAG: hypothetical protein NZ824_10665 [Candidatus Thioglobus sp.]|nr:hypothetical protein [Candidatus Thioglobus sp.]
MGLGQIGWKELLGLGGKIKMRPHTGPRLTNSVVDYVPDGKGTLSKVVSSDLKTRQELAPNRTLVDGQIEKKEGTTTSGDFTGINTEKQLTPEQIVDNNKKADVKLKKGWAKRYNILLEDGNLFTGTQKEIASMILGDGATPEQIYRKTPQISSILKGVRGNKEARAHAAEQSLLPENERTYPLHLFNQPPVSKQPKRLFIVRLADGTDKPMTKAEIVKEYNISLGTVERRFNGTVGTEDARNLAKNEGIVEEGSFQDGRAAGPNKRTVDPLERLKNHIRGSDGKFTKKPEE